MLYYANSQRWQDSDCFSLFISFKWGGLNGSPFVVAMKIKSRRKRMEQKKVFYICNRKKCPNCYGECHHTADISFALYKEHDRFEPGPDGTLWELRHGKGIC